MNGKLLLSTTVALLIVAVGGFLAVLGRLDALETDREASPRGRPPGIVPAAPAEPSSLDGDPLESRDPLVKLDYLIRKLQESDADAYDYYSEILQDLFALKREVRQLKSTLKQVVQGLGRTGQGVGGGWGLKPRGGPLDAPTAEAYAEAAREHGVRVEDGRVTVRGFLNLSPRTDMPIEYFITRFPEAGHETLVHVIGDKTLEQLAENPYGGLKGLATAIYKGMVVAGFREGEPTHPDPNSDPKSPRWVLPTGDPVYLAVRYQLDGRPHVALATDWVLDPVAGTVLPIDCLRFTGSMRGEDPDTGDEILASEAMGHIVSVWPNAASMVEVALESALRNDYAYNFSRIPKPPEGEVLYLDVIFSRTPVEPEGDGAAALERPPPLAGPGEAGPR